jgi:outer membrane protein OmpA-like peptidoglycan-associated protein/tetratricopeptide (TPR) repeat protein
VVLFLFIGINGGSQLYAQKSINSVLNDAKKKRSKLDYSQAIKLFQEALEIEPQNSKALEGLVEIYLYQYELYDSAEVYIKKRIASAEMDPNDIIRYDYANCLRLQERPIEAIEQYQHFKKNGLTKNKNAYLDEEVNFHLETCRYAIKNKAIVNDNNTYSVENMEFFINSVDSEYTPVFIEEDSVLLYNARYKDFESEEITEDNKYYENIYYFDLVESVASSYNPGIKQDNHHAVIGRRRDNKDILIFYKNKIWKSSIGQDRLNEIDALPEIFGEYYFQPHGVYSADGKTFIFSAMDKTKFEGGDLNIFVSYLTDTTWSAPKFLSPIINSEKDDDSPFLSEDGKTLYFSSKGHNSSGGYDFYKSELVSGEWTYPENLGYPMNSAGDDIYLSFTEDGKKGFFSSNRFGGYGGMDIYTFAVDQKTIAGVTYDKKGNPLPDVIVTLINLTSGGEVYESSDENGVFEFQVDSDQEFKLLGEKTEYFDGTNTVNTLLIDKLVTADLNLEKDPGISLMALITDKKTGEALDSVKMSITDNMTGDNEVYLTTEEGNYRRAVADKKLNDRGSYNFTLEKEGYLSKTITYNTVFDKEGIYNVHTDMDLSLEKIEVGVDLSEVIDINPIYFDVNKSIIRPDAALELDKIVTVMNENSNMVVELGSHTDSRGSARSNESLSDRRAKASADYIKARITNPERINGKGFGETILVNRCADGIKCSKEEHQENRRTEFIIVRL